MEAQGLGGSYGDLGLGLVTAEFCSSCFGLIPSRRESGEMVKREQMMSEWKTVGGRRSVCRNSVTEENNLLSWTLGARERIRDGRSICCRAHHMEFMDHNGGRWQIIISHSWHETQNRGVYPIFISFHNLGVPAVVLRASSAFPYDACLQVATSLLYLS